MPRPPRRPKDRRESYGPGHVEQLLTGQSLKGPSFSASGLVGCRWRDPLNCEAARLAWADLRDELMERWAAEQPPFTRPFGWWAFEHDQLPPRHAEFARDYLVTYGLLTEAEREALA